MQYEQNTKYKNTNTLMITALYKSTYLLTYLSVIHATWKTAGKIRLKQRVGWLFETGAVLRAVYKAERGEVTDAV